MSRLDQSVGKAFQNYNDRVRHQSQHWATTFLDKDVDHYDYLVTFWKRVERKKMALGAVTEPVPKTLWKTLGTRQGRLVSQVIGGTPASDADIWEGDVLLAINGEKITSEEGWGKLLQRYQGQEVKITLWRDGNFFEAPVMLN
jgi:S1-C subfamily serine protease